MKKLLIFFIFIIFIVISMWLVYNNYKIKYNTAKKENLEYEYYYQKEVSGVDVATIINKAIDNNKKNEIQLDNNNKYIENDKNSIKINVHMMDDDNTYDMESLYNGGISDFVQYYGSIKFKCTQMEYHDKTNKVKYMYFEQITK